MVVGRELCEVTGLVGVDVSAGVPAGVLALLKMLHRAVTSIKNNDIEASKIILFMCISSLFVHTTMLVPKICREKAFITVFLEAPPKAWCPMCNFDFSTDRL